jgi:NitT/TauT family transport system substrate-binding protein
LSGNSRYGQVARGLALAVVWALVACGGGGSSSSGAQSSGKFSGTIHIASSTWTGYAALYVADKKGFWQKHGLSVDFTDVEDPVQRLNALNAGQLQGMASTVDAFARAASEGVPAVQVWPIDASVGGDGILAKNEIQDVKALKGRSVAVNQGSVSEWFLAQVLKRNGMSLSDVKEQNMTSGDAGAAFVAGRVDVAVTWEPWLSRAAKTAFGRVLVSSKEYPDLIVDTFALRKDFIDKYPDTVKEMVKAYYDALDWFGKNKDEGNALVGTAIKEKPEDVAADLTTIQLMDLAQGKQFMGSKSHPGKIFDRTKEAAQFWKDDGKVQRVVSPDKAVDPSFISAA